MIEPERETLEPIFIDLKVLKEKYTRPSGER